MRILLANSMGDELCPLGSPGCKRSGGMMKLSSIVAATLCSVIISVSITSATMLGTAGDYNLFLSGGYSASATDAQGKIAAGGNVTLSNYSVGLYAVSSAYSLVTGGNVNFSSGSIQHGGIFSHGDITLKNHGVYGDVVAGGAVNITAGTITGGVFPYSGAANPIDFAAEFLYLDTLSNSLAAMAPTGATAVAYKNITLTGSDHINVFSVNGSDLAVATGLKFNIGLNDIAIVNVSGIADSMGNFGISGAVLGNVLLNFFEADTLAVKNIHVPASILAPGADLSFNSGLITGNVIARSASGSGQYNWKPFAHDVQPVPEPATWALMGAGLVSLVVLRRRMKN